MKGRSDMKWGIVKALYMACCGCAYIHDRVFLVVGLVVQDIGSRSVLEISGFRHSRWGKGSRPYVEDSSASEGPRSNHRDDEAGERRFFGSKRSSSSHISAKKRGENALYDLDTSENL